MSASKTVKELLPYGLLIGGGLVAYYGLKSSEQQREDERDARSNNSLPTDNDDFQRTEPERPSDPAPPRTPEIPPPNNAPSADDDGLLSGLLDGLKGLFGGSDDSREVRRGSPVPDPDSPRLFVDATSGRDGGVFSPDRLALRRAGIELPSAPSPIDNMRALTDNVSNSVFALGRDSIRAPPASGAQGGGQRFTVNTNNASRAAAISEKINKGADRRKIIEEAVKTGNSGGGRDFKQFSSQAESKAYHRNKYGAPKNLSDSQKKTARSERARKGSASLQRVRAQLQRSLGR